MIVRQRGFTLIELLVVISIIGLLSSVILTSLNAARSKARDGQRIAQAREFMKALEIYYVAFGSYPCSDTTVSPCPNAVRPLIPSLNIGQALVSSGAISQIPPDPLYPAAIIGTDCNLTGFGYCYCGIGDDSYVITINTEDDKGSTDRCFIRHGPNASLRCAGHHGDPGEPAGQECSDRF